jgi:hypothetical protein
MTAKCRSVYPRSQSKKAVDARNRPKPRKIGQKAVFPIVLALGTIFLVFLVPGALAQDAREGPIEIEKCQTISSYKLVNNLTFTGTTGTCLTITASFVTIDLAGFTISRPPPTFPSNNTMGIAAGNDTAGITVRNGSISGFGSGVALAGSNSIVEGLHVGFPCPCSGPGIAATGIVRGNTVSIASTMGFGVGIDATGIVSGNYVFDSGSLGITVGQGSTVIGNTVTGIQGGSLHPPIGLLVACPSNVTNNTLVNNRGLDNTGQNLVLNGDGCNNTNNVAP